MTRIQKELTQKVISGDLNAFEILFKRMYTPLCIYANSILRNEEMARDVVQQTFVNLWEKRKRFEAMESWKSLLYRLVYNSSIDVLRHQKVEKEFIEFLNTGKEMFGEAEIEKKLNNESREILLRKVYHVIDQLPDQCREIFLLHRFSGKKCSEIAQDLTLSVRTVEHQLYRAMKFLKDQLSGSEYKNLLFLFFLQKKSKLL